MNAGMKIEIDTKEDSHEEIRKAIKLLQHIIGDSQEVFTNAPTAAESSDTTDALNSIFGDGSSTTSEPSAPIKNEEPNEKTESIESAESTEDLFAELFSEEELKKMEPVKEEEEEIKPAKSKKYGIEFY